MQLFLLVLHVIITLAIISAILFQKGEEINAATSNPYNNMFSGRGGSGNDMTKITAILAAMFFSSCLLMAIWVKKEAQLTQYVKPKEKVIPSGFFEKESKEDKKSNQASAVEKTPSAQTSTKPTVAQPVAATETAKKTASPAASKGASKAVAKNKKESKGGSKGKK